MDHTYKANAEPFSTYLATPLKRVAALLCALAALPVHAQDHAYVTTPNSGALVAFDSATLQLAGGTNVGINPSQSIVDYQRNRVYVANTGSDNISVIERPSNALLQTIAVGDQPGTIAITPAGDKLYVGIAGGQVQVVDISLGTVQTTISVGGSSGIAITPDGTRAYVTGGLIYVIDTSTNSVTQSFSPGQELGAEYIVIKPDGSKAYVTANALFGGVVAVVDLSTNTVNKWMSGNGLTGHIAIAPDGSRVYLGDVAHWVDTGYGAGFLPGRTVTVFDASNDSRIGVIDLGAAGNVWNLQNTAAGLAVAADRSAVFVAVPRTNQVIAASTSTHQILNALPISGPRNVATASGGVPLVPYLINAADDAITTPIVGGVVLASVRSNDTLGGVPVTNDNTVLSVEAASAALSLDLTTGAVSVAEGTSIGTYQLTYRLCESQTPSNCDTANVNVSIRQQYVIDAVDDAASGTPGRAVLASVLSNDSLNGAIATRTNVRISLVSASSTGISLDTTTGTVSIATSATAGAYSLVYRICEIASPANCDSATVSVNVTLLPIDAVDDAGSISRLGGTVINNVLANDRFANAAAITTRVSLVQLTSSDLAISLNTSTGAISVAANTAVGSYTLTYRICELARPDNCDDAQANITVSPYTIDAVNDTARGSSKRANTALASVLTNDRFAGAAASTANVQLRQVSLSPANSMIRLDLTDGSVDVLGRTSSGLYLMTYEICERADPSNCDQATVTLDLSGGG
jgi:YVTN family beta-propeller protein